MARAVQVAILDFVRGARDRVRPMGGTPEQRQLLGTLSIVHLVWTLLWHIVLARRQRSSKDNVPKNTSMAGQRKKYSESETMTCVSTNFEDISVRWKKRKS